MSQRDGDQLTVHGIDFLLIGAYETITDVGESWYRMGRDKKMRRR